MFLSSGEEKETSTLLQSLERANLNHSNWRLPLSKGPKRVDVSFPLPEDGNRSRFRNVMFYSIKNSGR
jgi:hypothetical protein